MSSYDTKTLAELLSDAYTYATVNLALDEDTWLPRTLGKCLEGLLDTDDPLTELIDAPYDKAYYTEVKARWVLVEKYLKGDFTANTGTIPETGPY
jgi:hypothetical protein